MKCEVCGNEVPQGSIYCDNCGSKLNDVNTAQNSCFCANCGAKLEDDDDFCGICGYQVNKTGMESSDIYLYDKPKRKYKYGIVIVSVVIIVTISVIFGYRAYLNWNKDFLNNSEIVQFTEEPQTEDERMKSYTSEETYTQGSTSTPTEHLNAADTGAREDLYDPALTYKRMPDIHNTKLTDDVTFFELKGVIEEFNAQCAEYMNGITDEVPSLLKVGSTAYNQQVEYKKNHPLLKQSFQKIDVINAREGGGYYYVWVTEVLNIDDGGKKDVTTDHWVYKIEKINYDWYICDYTSDPLFN